MEVNMDQFENNETPAENPAGAEENAAAAVSGQTGQDGYNAQPADVNRSGGVFAEQSFSANQDVRNPSGVNANYGYGYMQGSGQAPTGADMQYRSMYGNRSEQNPQGMPQGNIVQNNGGPYQGQPYYSYAPQPEIPPVSVPMQKEMKKSSKIWLIISLVAVPLLFAAVMLLLAMNHKDNDGVVSNDVSEGIGGGVTVNINVQPHPAADDSAYADKEKGLFTTWGAAEQVLPSIVNLYGYTSTAIAAYNEASGVIISEDGYIITNAHAVEDINRFKAKLYDGREFEAKVTGIDTRTDIAVLKIDADDLTAAVIGSSDDMKQGEQVVAIGNAGGFNDTVTVGYVSYVNREIKSYTGYPITCIQTDAALNFGNSGGALINLYGQVVGIVVSKYSSTGSENIGFAIASDFAVPVAEDLIEKGYVSGRARIGIIYTLITAENASALEVKPGMLIAEIDPDCDVAKTDLQKDDIITELNGRQILTSEDIMNFQNMAKAGDKVTAKVYRKTITGEETEFEIEFVLEEYK